MIKPSYEIIEEQTKEIDYLKLIIYGIVRKEDLETKIKEFEVAMKGYEEIGQKNTAKYFKGAIKECEKLIEEFRELKEAKSDE